MMNIITNIRPRHPISHRDYDYDYDYDLGGEYGRQRHHQYPIDRNRGEQYTLLLFSDISILGHFSRSLFRMRDKGRLCLIPSSVLLF